MSEKVMLQDFTRPAFEEYLSSEDNPVAIIPLGSIEQHGPHLPLGTDSFVALKLARIAASRTNSLVVQPCWPGFSPHHMGFAGTITFRWETLMNIILDTVESLVTHGMKKVLLLNAHGGNAQIAALSARLAKRRFGAQVLMPGGSGGSEPAKLLEEVDVHAGRGETGMALSLFPELVEMDRLEGFQPTAEFPPDVERLRDPEADDAQLRAQLVMAYIGDTHEFTESGVYGFTDPNDADAQQSKKDLDERMEKLVKLIEYWKQIDLP